MWEMKCVYCDGHDAMTRCGCVLICDFPNANNCQKAAKQRAANGENRQEKEEPCGK
jgi:hypothetical protein